VTWRISTETGGLDHKSVARIVVSFFALVQVCTWQPAGASCGALRLIDFPHDFIRVVGVTNLKTAADIAGLGASFQLPQGEPLETYVEDAMRSILVATVGIVVLLVGAVRAEDTSSKPDEEGFIRNWLVLAPLPFGEAQNGAEALGKEQVAGEAKLQPKEGEKVKSGDKELTWKPVKLDSHLLDFNAFLGNQTEDSVAYAVCYLVADDEMKDLTMKTGSDDQAKVYLNGKEVFKFEEPRAADKDQDSTPNVTLKKGVNVIVFKVVNEKVDWSGCLRFTDKDGKPITNFKVNLKP
jgi:hypothetical protein